MEVTNYREIEKIKLLYPELMAQDAEYKIVTLFNNIQHLKDTIATRSMALEELRKLLKQSEQKWQILQNLIEITYKTTEKEEVKGEINLGFNFGTEVNKHIH